MYFSLMATAWVMYCRGDVAVTSVDFDAGVAVAVAVADCCLVSSSHRGVCLEASELPKAHKFTSGYALVRHTYPATYVGKIRVELLLDTTTTT